MDMKRRILIIDDDRDHLALCKLIFVRRGFSVLTMAGCDTLMETVIDFKPGLIFMDYHMPGICGEDAIKLLKSDVATKNIPVVLFSSVFNIEELAKRAGSDAYLTKPFSFDQLMELTSQFI